MSHLKTFFDTPEVSIWGHIRLIEKEHQLKKGESMRLHKGEDHYVVAEKRFKALILISLE